jgi:uncharacterized RDD family membrane protein YckC
LATSAADPAPPSPSVPVVTLAGLRRRLASLVYEALLVVALVFVTGALVLPLAHLLDPALSRPLFRAATIAALAVYFVWCWSHGGNTLPMKTWRLRLVTTEGKPLTARDAWRRFLFAVPCTSAAGLGYAWALLDRERQFLHDRLAGTRIVRDER